MALWQLPSCYRVVALVCNIQQEQQRVSIHGVRRELIERQATALQLPLYTVDLPDMPNNVVYEARVEAALRPFLNRGVKHVVYGDLFLADIRAYRDAFLTRIGLQAVYPLWQKDTRTLLNSFIHAGFRSVITCVDTTQLNASFVGRELDTTFLKALPASVDPCGENGEFHTFVYAGPLFRHPLSVIIGESFWQDDRFRLCDLR